MSVETLQRLHGRYTDLSSRFRAGWAFHQYAEGVRKIHPGDPSRPVVTEGFQAVYGSLKAISSRLNVDDPGVVEKELQSVGERLRRLTATLAEEDNRVPPELVRQFFRRVKNDDENVLTQIVKFYLHMGDVRTWPADRLDKVDFLLTRLAEERDPSSDRFVLVESRRLFELANGFWAIARAKAEDGVGFEGSEDAHVERITNELRSLRRDVAAISNLEELNDGGLVDRFRGVKHGLGPLFFHPRLMGEILETNLVFKNLVRELYSVEERRITADYQRVFDLERETSVDGDLDADLRSFREEVEGFEQRLQRDELKLRELAHLRERIRTLSTRLSTGDEDSEYREETTRPGVVEMEETESAGARTRTADEILIEAIAHLDAALDEVPTEVPARRAVLGSALYGMRLEARELEAHRRLRGGQAESEVERTVFEAAALRVIITQQVDEIRALLDETATTGEATVFRRTRHTLRLATGYLGRLESAAEQALLRGDLEEAQVLTVSKMRLVREHAGAWLLAMRPLLARQGSV